MHVYNYLVAIAIAVNRTSNLVFILTIKHLWDFNTLSI